MIKTKKSIGGGAVCKSLVVLERLRKKKAITPEMYDLAKAQAEDNTDLKKDSIEMNKRLTSIESKVAEIQANQASMREEQVAQGAKLDLIIKRLDGPAEAERIDGIKWQTFTSLAKSKMFWIMVVIVVLAFMFSGPNLGKLLVGWIPLG